MMRFNEWPIVVLLLRLRGEDWLLSSVEGRIREGRRGAPMWRLLEAKYDTNTGKIDDTSFYSHSSGKESWFSTMRKEG